MKILGLLGSHRSDGLTAKMLEQVMAGIDDTNQKEIVFLNDYNIQPDNGQSNPILDELTEKLLAADVWIIAAPTYWGALSGVMKNFFDCMRPRLVRFNKDGRALPDRFKDKHYVSLSNCYISGLENMFVGVTDGTFKTIDKVLTSAGLVKIKEMLCTNSFHQPTITTKKAVALNKLGTKIVAKASRKDFLMKRYLQLLCMVAIMALLTMGIQQLLMNVLPLNEFWWNYLSFVIIFFVLLATILHIVTFMLHKRK